MAAQRKPISLDELAERVQLHKSITYRLIRSLENAGFVARDPILGGYSTGSSLLSLGVAISSRIDIRRVVRASLEEIVRTFGETVSLHVRSGDQRVCIDVAEGTHAIRRVIPVGEMLPLYAGETGRILLSGLTPAELEHQMEIAQSDGVDVKALASDITQAGEKGWIIGIGMRTPEVGSLSVRLLGASGLVGALTVSGPSGRWNESAMAKALPKILQIVGSLTADLSRVAA